MATPRVLPEIGRVVEVVQGRDRGSFAVVVGHADTRFVLIADGASRRVERPKRKNVMHIRNTGHVAAEIDEALRDQGKVTNARLRHVLRQFLELRSVTESKDEGGVSNGEG